MEFPSASGSAAAVAIGVLRRSPSACFGGGGEGFLKLLPGKGLGTVL